MHKERLLTLARLLEADSRKKRGIKFDMFTWGELDDNAKPLSCGTSACAMGLAALSGKFKRAGLNYSVRDDGRLVFKWKGKLNANGFEVAEKLFGITPYTAELLFSAGATNIPSRNLMGAGAERRKAKQIRKLVKTGER